MLASGTVTDLLSQAREGQGPVVFLTGAGISQESGIPTFRGEEGYWRVGSVNYRPMELATHAAFRSLRSEVWTWYLHRRAVCNAALPNPAHYALAELEHELGDQFLLITQNVDGLHRRAGSSARRTYQIHGDINQMRCEQECTDLTYAIPENLRRLPAPDGQASAPLTAVEEAALACPGCGAPARPHVLWFDESYNEVHFRFDSAHLAARSASLLVVVGTTGATNLPLQIGSTVARRGAPMLVLNPEANPFSELAADCGIFLRGTAGALVPEVCAQIRGAYAGR